MLVVNRSYLLSGDNKPAHLFSSRARPRDQGFAHTRAAHRVGAPIRERQVPAVERAIAILRLLARSQHPRGVQAIARELGLVPSTCLHILRVLVSHELAGFDPETKRYWLDAGILSIARGVLGHTSFSQVVQPALDRIAKAHAVTANAVRVIGLAHGTVVAISHAAQPFQIHVGVGSRFPALVSVTGRCIAAFGNHDRGDIERAFLAVRWDRPPSLRDWQREVEATRKRGYAVDPGNYISGITIVGAPITRRGWVNHVIVGIGLTEQLTPSRVAKLGKDLVAEARRHQSV
jgi:DNA-binding IclR family transcriptional regulator